MLIKVLGSAAGGGFPQWNCHCTNCLGLRNGAIRASARTQSSIALSADGDRWVVVNASPDLPAQIEANPCLQPRRGPRDTPIAAVLTVDGQVDHVIGLVLLRNHGAPLPVWTTAPVRDDLSSGLPLLSVLGHYCGVDWHEITPDGTAFGIPALPGVRLAALAVAGKPGPYSAYRERPRPGDNIALLLEDTASGGRALYAPGLAAITPAIAAALGRSDVVLVDGTFWQDDEMIRAGVSGKRAADLGHLPQSGPGGMLEVLAALPVSTRRILIHINNTNPILDEDSPQRGELARAGVEVAFDGMEIRL
jgi:pyrroloquinoline quinone biosynthesis protein B